MFKGKGKVKLSYKKKPTPEQVEKAREQKKLASQKRLDDLTEKIVMIDGKKVRILKSTSEPSYGDKTSNSKINEYFKTLKNNNLIN